ncbi:signal peptidase I [Candidatus Parcubacteria bacterium]|nr:signal peptidase I [Candidatus Parcubacteria bacterium]
MNNIPIYGDPNPQPFSQPEPTPQKPKKKLSREVISTLLIIAAAPLIAFILTIFVFQSYEVEGDSMEPTLQNKDRLIVNKINKTWSNVSGHNYLPERFEIIIFNYTGSNTNGEGDKQLIKRVVGLPGDRIVIKDGAVTIYNDGNPDGFNPKDKDEQLDTAASTTDGNIDETIGKGEVFVMGDNRQNSLDSRVFGPVSTSEIIGNLALRIYPLDEVQRY